jgi:hypothetical protein
MGRHAGVESVHRLRDDAAGFASVEEASGRRLLVAPVIDDLVQRMPGHLGMALQVAIEAQQQLFIGVVPIAEHAHVRDVFLHHLSEEAAEGWQSTQLLQRRVTVFADEGSHNWRGVRAILPVNCRERVRSDYPLFLQPLEISLDQESPMIKYVWWPFETAFLQP